MDVDGDQVCPVTLPKVKGRNETPQRGSERERKKPKEPVQQSLGRTGPVPERTTAHLVVMKEPTERRTKTVRDKDKAKTGTHGQKQKKTQEKT